MPHRLLPKEAVREGQRARQAGVPRTGNPYDRPFMLTRTNAPEFNAAGRLKAAWFTGWDTADEQLQAEQAKPRGQLGS